MNYVTVRLNGSSAAYTYVSELDLKPGDNVEAPVGDFGAWSLGEVVAVGNTLEEVNSAWAGPYRRIQYLAMPAPDPFAPADPALCGTAKRRKLVDAVFDAISDLDAALAEAGLV